MELRDYQKKAVLGIINGWKKGDATYCNLITGSGKSLVLAELTRRALALGYRVLQLVPTKELVEQNYQEYITHTKDYHNVGIVCSQLGKTQGHNKAVIAMVHSFVGKRHKFGKFDVLLIDECDLVGYDPKSQYRKIIDTLKHFNPDLKIAGVTGSPYRMKTGLLENPHETYGESIFKHRSYCTDEIIPEMIEKGYLSQIESISGDIQADMSNVSLNSIGEYNTEMMSAKFHDIIPHAVKDMALKIQAYGMKSILVFASNIENAELILNEYKESTGLDNIRMVTGESSKKVERRINIDWFCSANGVRVLVNVGILTRGYNYRALDCVVFMRSTMSLALYVQCLDYQTEILTKNGWKKHGQICPGDIVAGFNLKTKKSEWQNVINVFDRPAYEKEKFIKIKSGHLDIRVTDNHNMVIKSKGSNAWVLEKANISINRKTGGQIPVSSDMQLRDCNISDCYLSFIGWFLADGTKNKKNNVVSISQRLSAKENNHIINTLNECGFRYGIKEAKRKGFVFGKSAENYENILNYYISYGNARIENGTGIYGWNIIEQWIDKSIPEYFNLLSKRQLLIVLKSMDMANGSKKITDYTQKTMDICVGHNRIMADRIQELCILRGLRCNIKEYKTLILSISDKQVSHIRGSSYYDNNKNQKMEYDNASINERVWCIETPLNTIVTRRNGKVAILGNCVGRVIRAHDEKEKGYVIDYGGNIERFGPINKIIPPEQRKKGEKASKKECFGIADKTEVVTINEVAYTLIEGQQCGYMNHNSAKFCKLCGAEFIPDPDSPGKYSMRSHAEVLELKNKKSEDYSPIDNVYVETRFSKGGELMVLLFYVSEHVIVYKHHLCFDHAGYARHQAIKFLRAWAINEDDISELHAENMITSEHIYDMLSDKNILEKYFKKIKGITLKKKKDSKYKDLVSVEFE